MPATWAVVMPAPIALFGSTTTSTDGVPCVMSVLRLTMSGWSLIASRTGGGAVATGAWSGPLTTTLRPLVLKPLPPETVTSQPSALTGARAARRFAVSFATSASLLRRAVSVALFAARPVKAAESVWKPVSPSPGTVVCTSVTAGFAFMIPSAWMARSRTAFDGVPEGGETLTLRTFCEPVLMNCVGMLGTSARVATKSTEEMPRTPSLVARLRSANLIVGV